MPVETTAASEAELVVKPPPEASAPLTVAPSPPPKQSWLQRLRAGLSRSSTTIARGVTDIFTKRKLDAASLDEAAPKLPEGTRDDEELVLRVPYEGGIRPLRDLLARLGDDVAVEDVSIHTPDLEDVFFALTGNASNS